MIGVTKSELREIIYTVFTSRFIESDPEYLEDTIDQIIDDIELSEHGEEEAER